MQDREWPQEAELVVCTVENVKDFVAFVSLDEYGGRQGLIPISEIATGWIKYIRDHIREGQKIVCKVLNVDRSRGHIDLSLKDVNEHQRREKIREWKNESKAQKWLGFAAEQSGEDRRRSKMRSSINTGHSTRSLKILLSNLKQRSRNSVFRRKYPMHPPECGTGKCQGSPVSK